MRFIFNRYYIVIFAEILFFSWGQVAQAQIVSVSASVNLRQGPGPRYARIAAIPRGARVEVINCQSSWCQVSTSWGRGWVSRRYIWSGNNAVPVAPPVPVYGGGYYPDYWGPASQVFLGLNLGGYGGGYDPYYGRRNGGGWPYYGGHRNRPNWGKPNWRGPNWGGNPRQGGGGGGWHGGQRGGQPHWNPLWGVGPRLLR